MSETMFVVNINPMDMTQSPRPFDSSAIDAFTADYLVGDHNGLTDSRGRDVDISADTITFGTTLGYDDSEMLYALLSSVGGTAVGADLTAALSCDTAWLGAPQAAMDTLIVVDSVEDLTACLTMNDIPHPGIYRGSRECIRKVKTISPGEHVAQSMDGNIRVTLSPDHAVTFTGPWFDSPRIRFTEFSGLVPVPPPSTFHAYWGRSPTTIEPAARYLAYGWLVHLDGATLVVENPNVTLTVDRPHNVDITTRH